MAQPVDVLLHRAPCVVPEQSQEMHPAESGLPGPYRPPKVTATVNRTESPAETATWNPVSGEFLNCDNFGVLTLGDKAEADSRPSAPGVTECRLSIDWQALGLDPAHTRASEPAIDHFQEGKTSVDLNAPFVIPEGKGLLIRLKADR